jgi:CBS domain-containing protein
MSSPAITVSPEHSLGDCLRLVTHHRIRHLPVIDNGQLAGVVSIGDLAKAIISAQADAVNQLSNYIAGNYPA